MAGGMDVPTVHRTPGLAAGILGQLPAPNRGVDPAETALPAPRPASFVPRQPGATRLEKPLQGPCPGASPSGLRRAEDAPSRLPLSLPTTAPAAATPHFSPTDSAEEPVIQSQESEVVSPATTYALGDGLAGDGREILPGQPILAQRLLNRAEAPMWGPVSERHRGKSMGALATDMRNPFRCSSFSAATTRMTFDVGIATNCPIAIA